MSCKLDKLYGNSANVFEIFSFETGQGMVILVRKAAAALLAAVLLLSAGCERKHHGAGKQNCQ